MEKMRTNTESRLAYRVRMLSAMERTDLLNKLGMGRTTLFHRLNDPGKLTLDEARTITRFLEALDNEDYDIYEMLRPVEITAKATA